MQKQEKNYTCGCAVVKSIIHNFEILDVPESELEIILKTDPEIGTHPSNIKQFFINRNYDVIEKFDSSLDQIDLLSKQGYLIVLTVSVDLPHFTIYDSMNSHHVKFNDPMFGAVNVLIKKFISNKASNPSYRWKIVNSEFKKYLKSISKDKFLEKDYHKHFIAFKKRKHL